MSEYEVYSYESFRRRTREELRPASEVRIQLFNRERLQRYILAVKEERPNLTSNVTNEEILELMGITVQGY